MYELISDEGYHYIISECATYGELLNEISSKPYTEEDIAYITKQLFCVISYCHSKGVIHKNLNIHNIFVESIKERRMEIKVGNFETGIVCVNKIQWSEELGTIDYIAPEVLKGVYVETSDVWSIGVILFVILSGLLPFKEHQTVKTLNFIGLFFYSL